MRIDRIKLISDMARRDMTTVKLSALSGISRATITGVRSGKSCSNSVGHGIAAALGVDVTELLHEER